MMMNKLLLDVNNSKTFEHIIDKWSLPTLGEFPSWFDATSFLYALLFLWFLALVALGRSSFLLFCKKAKNRISRTNSTFMCLAIWVFASGVLLYYIGYDYAGTDENVITLLLRSVLSSFEMFLSKSNLIGIADNCKADLNYMLCFAVIHASALAVSTLFAVLCFGRRIQYWFRGIKWRFLKSKSVTNVFWGLNERSFVLAHDIEKNSESKERFIFVDFPLQEESPSKGQSFSGILGLFSYKMNALKKLAGLHNCILMRSSLRPSNIQNTDADSFFDTMNLYRLKQILGKSEVVRFFIMTEDEKANLKAAINMLLANVVEENCLKIYCSARKNMLNRLIEEKWEDNLSLIDDSRASVTQLKMDSANMRHPIDYVDIDQERGVVTSKFKALIVGFGTTGQDALRFLYEFSAFPNEKGKKSPVEIHIIDCNMASVKGSFYQEVPAVRMLEGQEVFFSDLNVGSTEFDDFLNHHINDLNYVVVAVGNDEVNLDIASKIMDKALLSPAKKMSHFKVFVRMYNDENLIKFDTAVDIYQNFIPDREYKPLEYFGNTKAIYNYKIVINNNYEKQAISFYESYCKATNDTTTWTQRHDKEMNKYELKVYGRRSLRRKEGQDKANCQHCYTKWKLLNLLEGGLGVSLPNWTESKSILGIDEEQITPWLIRLYNISICEHLRWNASHVMLGYVPMTEEVRSQVDGTCDEVTKQHSCIVDWDKLSCDIQSYDYAVVKTTVRMKCGEI